METPVKTLVKTAVKTHPQELNNTNCYSLKAVTINCASFAAHVLQGYAARFCDAFSTVLLFQIHFDYIAQKHAGYAPI